MAFVQFQLVAMRPAVATFIPVSVTVIISAVAGSAVELR